MSKYDKQFKEEAVKPAKEIGARKAVKQYGMCPFLYAGGLRDTPKTYPLS